MSLKCFRVIVERSVLRVMVDPFTVFYNSSTINIDGSSRAVNNLGKDHLCR
jgi:hypothetical protein